jgi:histidine ammonia-lyase
VRLDQPAIVLDGASMTLEDLALAADGTPATALPEALERVADAHRLATTLAERQPVYGRSTGVGAARDESVTAPDHGLRLLRAHAAGWGQPLPDPVVRAACAVRANQLLVGRSGASPALAEGLLELVGAPAASLPVVHRHGSVGTGDLTALAEVGLALCGERPRRSGEQVCRLVLSSSDAVPLMSSSAFTLAESGLAAVELAHLAEVADVVCALSWAVLRGSPEPVGLEAAPATPHAGAQRSMAAIRALLDPADVRPAQLQDFFGLRAWPQVHGPLHDALAALLEVVQTACNTGSENPLVGDGGGGGRVTHHGGFHTAYLALALDQALLAMSGSAQGVMSRVTHLVSGGEAGLPRFLTDGTPGSAGLLIGEYVAGSALALVRQHAGSPSSVQSVSLSQGVEDDAGFASLAAMRLGGAVPAYRRLIAVELVAATRAAVISGAALSGPLGGVLDATRDLAADLADHDLGPDFEEAESRLDRLTELRQA